MNKDTNKSEIITASEIGQYQYCSISWRLQRNGLKPDSSNLKKGIKNHISHGNTISYTNRLIKKSKILTIIGYLLLFFAILLILFGVIL